VRSPAARCLLLALSSSAASSLLLGGRLHPIFRAEAGEKHQVLLLLQKNFIKRSTDLPKRSTDLENAVQTCVPPEMLGHRAFCRFSTSVIQRGGPPGCFLLLLLRIMQSDGSGRPCCEGYGRPRRVEQPPSFDDASAAAGWWRPCAASRRMVTACCGASLVVARRAARRDTGMAGKSPGTPQVPGAGGLNKCLTAFCTRLCLSAPYTFTF
jgi:hypothetical protein